MSVTDDPVAAPATDHHIPAPRRPRSNRRSGGGQGLFRAFWRWHFYASFLVIPLLLMLSVTGLIYLLRFQIEPALNAGVMKVSAPAGSDVLPQSYNNQLKAVAVAYPDATVGSMTEPLAADRATVFSVDLPSGSRDV